jgi:long-chain fatty acid transport protein
MNRHIAVSAIAMIAAAGLGGRAHAAGFALSENSAIESGEADAGKAAAADDLSTITSNPAGMTSFSDFVSSAAAAHFIMPQGSFTLTGAHTSVGPQPIPESGGAGPDATATATVPSAYLIVAPTSDLRLGVGVSVPFGLTTHWNADSAARYQALESKVQSVDVNPSIAYRLAPWLSVGAGISAQWAKVELGNAIDFGTLVPLTLERFGLISPAQAGGLLAAGSGRAVNDGRVDVDGDSWNVGYDFGAIVEPMPGTRIGASYRSSIDQHITGTATFSVPAQYAAIVAATGQFVNTGASATLALPDNFMIGISQQVGSGLTLNATYQWTEWSRFKAIAISFANPLQAPATQAETYRDTSFVSVGGSLALSDALTLRAGAAYDETPVTDAFRDLRLPDGDRYWVTVGATYNITRNLAITGSYEHLFFDDAAVNHSDTITPGVVNTVTGTAAISADLLGVELSFHI